MSLDLSSTQKSEVLSSIQRFFREELDLELSDMRAGFLLEYISKEIAPLAYNQGVEDAQKHLRSVLEDLPGTCFQEPLTYWQSQPGGKAVRRKPGK